MSKFSSLTLLLLIALATGLFAISGCSQPTDDVENASEADATSVGDTGDHSTIVDDHSGWWCLGHGVPEEVCTRCDSSLIAEFKAKNDWCKEHDRPDSQCFLCNPELEAQFAARYEAKFGEQPPAPLDP